MGFTRSRKLLAAWLALLALALNAAWPLVAKAAPRSPAGLADICTVAHEATVGTGGSIPVDLAASHCAYCSFASEKALPPTQACLPIVASAPRGASFGVDIFIPRNSSRTLHAAPRAPPFVS
jgi:hypothetical protein